MMIPFVKMHGAGNDFIMLNGISDQLPDDLAKFSKAVCHRRFGVGADQVLILYPSESVDFRMDIYNADGGLVEMCGNGIRCFAKFVKDLGLTTQNYLVIETLGGLIKSSIIEDHPKASSGITWVRVDMGEPILEGAKIPVKQSGRIIGMEWELTDKSRLGDWETGRLGDKSQSHIVAKSQSHQFNITCVSMGNPHCVIFVDDVQNYPVERIGSVIENDPFFPNRVNVEFVQVTDRQHLIQRTWERGSGETFACGTGACAVAVAAVLNNVSDRKVTISLKGGDLDLYWDENNNHVYKTGPASTVFAGALAY